MRAPGSVLAVLLAAVPAAAQTTNDPFPEPIGSGRETIVVGVAEFATVPDVDGIPARMMLMVDEPGTRRFFVNDMRGQLYTVGYDGGEARLYLDINAPQWGVRVQSQGRERGFQSFAFHPQFAQPGTPGYGKFYTYTDTENTAPTPDFRPLGGDATHHTVLLEWTAANPSAPTYDGGPPRELMRVEQPYANHNGGHTAFNPTAGPGDPDFGMLYIGVADGGSGGDPLNMAQDLRSAFGKVFRIDPLGRNSANGKYGIPADNPFVGRADALPEIYALGVRNPQRFGWDPQTGQMYLADIGQNVVEKLSLVRSGANLGWNIWEGSFRYAGRSEVSLANPRSDPSILYPIAEYGQVDPILMNSSAATGVHVYRSNAIPQLANKILFGDMPIGEIFYVDADNPPDGGQAGIGRILLRHRGEPKRLLDIIQEKNAEQGRQPANRADMRFGSGADGRVFLINKQDGVIRVLTP